MTSQIPVDATLLSELRKQIADRTPSCNAYVDRLLRRAEAELARLGKLVSEQEPKNP